MAPPQLDAYNRLMPVGERGLLEPFELWPQEQQLCVKAAEGQRRSLSH